MYRHISSKVYDISEYVTTALLQLGIGAHNGSTKEHEDLASREHIFLGTDQLRILINLSEYTLQFFDLLNFKFVYFELLLRLFVLLPGFRWLIQLVDIGIVLFLLLRSLLLHLNSHFFLFWLLGHLIGSLKLYLHLTRLFLLFLFWVVRLLLVN
jgi:hypothetical protein